MYFGILNSVPLAVAVLFGEFGVAGRYVVVLVALLPKDSRVMLLDRDEKFMLPEPDSRLGRGDEVMVITHSRNIEKRHPRWSAARPRGNPFFPATSPTPFAAPARKSPGRVQASSGLR